MSESTEPSYYEIALTNRQVVIAFVILLTLVLAIFLCGVWIGKNGQERLAAAGTLAPTHPAAAPSEPDQLANMEEFKFFAEEGAKGEKQAETLDKPNLAALDKPSANSPQANAQETQQRPTTTQPSTTLAQDIGSERSAPSQTRSPQPATADNPSPPPATRPAPPASTPAPAKKPAAAPPTTRPAAPAAGDGFVVQVFSTRDEPQARKVLGELKGAGHRAFLSAVEVTGQTMYRVRVGPFSQRGEAEKIAGQVRRQMKLDPWVTAAGN